MAENNTPHEYDEDEAIKFIINYLPSDIKDKFCDDDINYIIDIVYDYYDSIGLLDESAANDAIVEIDEDEMLDYVLKNVKKDKVHQGGSFTKEDIGFIVQGELAYCDSIGLFE